MLLFFTMFVAGLLTILLPCILPLVPIVLGVSISGRSKWRPLLVIAGMLVSFVGFTFLLTVVLNQFVELADFIRIGTYYILLLFGLGFFTHHTWIHRVGALAGSAFFVHKSWGAVFAVAVLGVLCMEIGGRLATRIQQLGTDIQTKTQQGLGRDNPLTAFLIGLTMGLVWVPCAGPALGFAFTLVREQPGVQAALLLFAYGLGTAIPLLLIGYGGQYATHSVRSLSRFSGRVKQIAGVILILTALALNYHWFRDIEIFLVNNTSFGNLGVDLEMKLFGEDISQPRDTSQQEGVPSSHMNLPKITRAPEFTGLGTWHNSEPFSMADLRGKVVLVDFWTYSCINCIRTLPYIQGYWDKYSSGESWKDSPFVLLGVHTPEFVFEKSDDNVAQAISQHGLTYPVAQDNDYNTWRAFSNRYWPAKYLIDAEGYIRYTHFGEGAYDETDEAIATLLKEAGYEISEVDGVTSVTQTPSLRRDQSPETYLGTRSWPSLFNGPSLPTDAVYSYTLNDALPLHRYALVGDWQLVDQERQVLRSDSGEIHMKFLGSEINIVMGSDAEDIAVDVVVDGEEVQSLSVGFQDLYSLWKGEYGEHDIVIRIHNAGLSAYAFTFGSS